MRLVALIATLLALALPASAQPLTDQSIAQWAGSYRDLMAWSDANAVEPDVEPGADMFRRSMAAMAPGPHFPAIASLLAGHGYSDPMEWADLSDRIFSAYQAHRMGGAQAEIAAAQPQLMDTMKALLDNPNLTDAQKDEIKKSMGQMQGMAEMAQPDADPADIEAVARNQPVIDEALGVGRDLMAQ